MKTNMLTRLDIRPPGGNRSRGHYSLLSFLRHPACGPAGPLYSVILMSGVLLSFGASPEVGEAGPPKDESSPSQTNSAGTDKSQYHLFNPTPRSLMRELATDRPDKTESPYTVDAGHFQVELDFLSYAQDRDQSGGGDTRVANYAVAPINLKVGLLNRVDFQLILETWNRVKTEDRPAGTVVRQSGFGDVISRLKVNLWGNDGGPTAFSLMPFVKLPTNQDGLGNEAVEGGLILPLALALPREFSLGLMAEIDLNRSDRDGRYYPALVHTITLGHDLVGKLAGYVEFFSLVSTRNDAPWIGTVDLGLTYRFTPNTQLDAGVNLGVTSSADDINPFVGFSFRF